MKFRRIVLEVNTHRLTDSDFDFTSKFQDGGHGIISRGEVLPLGE